MSEVASPGEDHGEVVLVAGGQGLVVAPGAAGLDDGRDAGPGGEVGAVAEGEEGVGGEHRPPGPLAGLLDGDLDRVEPAHLAGTHADELPTPDQDDRVRLHRLADPPGESERGPL